MSRTYVNLPHICCRDADEAHHEAYEAQDGDDLDGGFTFSLPGIDIIHVEAERSRHQYPIDYTAEGEGLPSNTNQAYDFYEANAETLEPIWRQSIVHLVYVDGSTSEAMTLAALSSADDRGQVHNQRRDDVREVRCNGKHWRSRSKIECWSSLIKDVGMWAVIATATDAMATGMQDSRSVYLHHTMDMSVKLQYVRSMLYVSCIHAAFVNAEYVCMR